MAELKLKIPDMMCEHCEKRIRAAVEQAGCKVKSLDLETKIVVIETATQALELVSAIDDAGYDAEII
ncbi:MAG: heavy metal-associated domain-containing protein [Synergistaceae bacterium]|nr:heavy metal-associated domain-containing protein [Synergistaceae bacterium]